MNPESRTEAVDLNAGSIRDGLIWLPSLIRAVFEAGQVVVQNRTFTNCLLFGPAVFLAVRGVRMDGCNLGFTAGDVRNIVLLPASVTGMVVGAIPFQDCSFVDCDFDAVGFTGPKPFTDSVLALRTEGEP